MERGVYQSSRLSNKYMSAKNGCFRISCFCMTFEIEPLAERPEADSVSNVITPPFPLLFYDAPGGKHFHAYTWVEFIHSIRLRHTPHLARLRRRIPTCQNLSRARLQRRVAVTVSSRPHTTRLRSFPLSFLLLAIQYGANPVRIWLV